MSNTNLTSNWYETEVGQQILSKKYFHEGETFDDFINRVSGIFSEELQEPMKTALIEADFFPAGRSLYAAGAKGKFKASMSNCYIMPMPEDNIESIIEVAKKTARIFSYGGGAGINISNLRPKGAKVSNAARTSTGAVSFMEIYDSIGSVIGANNRRAALILGLNCDHPDLLDFLEVKKNNDKIQSANISILFDDDFMKAVRDNKNYKLTFEVKSTGEYISKTINARDFFMKFCEAQWDWAEPGALFIDRIRNHNLLSGYPESEYKIDICNPCVTGDTLILTKDGYKEIESLVEKEVEVWNGYEWSIVQPRVTGTDQPMKLVKLSNGMELKCTNYHKFVMKDQSRKQADKLVLGDKLAKWNYPVIEGTKELPAAYTHGFYSGDGTKGLLQICLYGEKKELLKHLDIDHFTTQTNVQNRISVILKDNNYAKDFVPNSTYTIKSRMEWLAGIIDSDGCLNDIGGSVSISSISKTFLLKVQLMLSTLGCHSSINVLRCEGNREMPDGKGGTKEYHCQESYRLVISAYNVSQLVELGLKTHRVKLVANPNRDASRFIQVTEVIDLPNEPVVFCFNEPKNHTGIFNGIMTAQCAEYTGSAYNACNLGSINLYNMVKNPFTKDATIDWLKFDQTVQLGVKALDEILDYGYDTQPLDENRKAIDDWRAIGLGLFGLGDALVALGIRYGSQESIELIDTLMKRMFENAVLSSAYLAKNKGTFGKYNWDYIKESPLLQQVSPEIQKKVQEYGLRNGSLLSIAPTGSISTMCGLSGGVEPLYQISYERTTHALEKTGKTFTVYAKSISHLLKSPSGKFGEQWIDKTKKLQEQFPYIVTSHDINPLDRVKLQATMQKYNDNAISSTVNLKNSATVEDVFDTYLAAWENGCKGITVFRDGCARTSILGKSDDKPQITKESIKLNSVKPIKRREIDDELDGCTKVKHTACCPQLYVTTNEKDGEIFEVFVNTSSGCTANIGTITRLASLALRSGVKVDDIVNEMKENKCGACTTLIKQGEKGISVSCGNAIADAIKEFSVKLKGTQETKDTTGLIECPNCGEKTLRPQGKCWECSNCFYSKCE